MAETEANANRPTIAVTYTGSVPDEVIDGLGVIFELAMREVERTPESDLKNPDAVAHAAIWLAGEKIARVAMARIRERGEEVATNA